MWKNRNVNGFVKYNKKQHYVDLYNDEYVYNLKKGKGEKKSNKGSTGHDKFGIIKEYSKTIKVPPTHRSNTSLFYLVFLVKCSNLNLPSGLPD